MEETIYCSEHVFSRICDTYPRALSAYLICLNRTEDDESFVVDRELISNTLCRSWCKFKNDIRSLSLMFLLNFVDHGDSLEIQMIPQSTSDML